MLCEHCKESIGRRKHKLCRQCYYEVHDDCEWSRNCKEYIHMPTVSDRGSITKDAPTLNLVSHYLNSDIWNKRQQIRLAHRSVEYRCPCGQFTREVYAKTYTEQLVELAIHNASHV